MKTLNLFCFYIILLFSNSIHSQNTFNEEVNNEIWVKFTTAFEKFDVDLFESLHSEEFIRVSGNAKNISDKKTYLDGYRERWKNNTGNQTISFRFSERINNGVTASERGIYKLTVNLGAENEASYYGEFHVILRKENGSWKLLVDYDSNPNNSVNEDTYIKANPQ